MSDQASTRFSAPDAALGYLYQVRIALLWALRRVGADDRFKVSIETLDDVTFEANGEPRELLQVKHHSKQANLTDASTDIWKTFRVWLSAIKDGKVAEQTTLFLVTTGTATGGACKHLLDNDARDEEAASKLLHAVSLSSSSTENKEGYELFNALTHEQRISFLKRIHIIDQSPRAQDVVDDLHHELRLIAQKDRVQFAAEAIEGWWFARVIKQMSASIMLSPISAGEIEAKLDDVREQLKRDTLPIDDELLTYRLDEATRAIYQKYKFVRQVELVTDNNTRIKRAIADYLRAFRQRASWARKELLFVGELAAYEQRLYDEWELQFSYIEEELGSEAAEEAQRVAGAALLKWVENVDIPFKSGMTSVPWVCRGSLHLLADSLAIGWHPAFKSRLAVLLELEMVEPA